MKAFEVMTDVVGKKFLEEHPDTADKIKYGDENKEVRKIATCLTVTPDLIREMKEWGADLVITHEPTFYNHFDVFEADKLSLLKKAALDDAGFAVYRYHDSMHFREEDEVNSSFIERMGWTGKFDGDMSFISDTAYTPREIADMAREKFNIRHPRIVGNPDFKGTNFRLATGMRGTPCYREFTESETEEIAICGELCEWENCEPIRDAGQFGLKKAIVIMGHAGSEKMAMLTLAENIDGKYDGAEARYFDCGEIYTYND